MTKKDYIRIAAALRGDAVHLAPNAVYPNYLTMPQWNKGAYNQWNTTVLAIAGALASEPGTRFDRARFLAACGVQS